MQFEKFQRKILGSELEGLDLHRFFFIEAIADTALFQALVVGANNFVYAAELTLASAGLRAKINQHIGMCGGCQFRAQCYRFAVVAAAIQQAMGHEAARGILPEHVIQRFRLLLRVGEYMDTMPQRVGFLGQPADELQAWLQFRAG